MAGKGSARRGGKTPDAATWADFPDCANMRDLPWHVQPVVSSGLCLTFGSK